MYTLRAGVVRVLTLGVDCFFGVRRCKKNKTKQNKKLLNISFQCKIKLTTLSSTSASESLASTGE